MVAVIYLVVFAIIMAVGCIEVGSRSSDKQEQSSEEGLMSYAIAGAFWPAVLAGFAIGLPFYGLYRLGRLLRSIR